MSVLTVRDVAKDQKTSTQTVRGWIASGELKAYRTQGASGPWRIRPERYAEFCDEREALRSDPWARTRPRRRTA